MPNNHYTQKFDLNIVCISLFFNRKYLFKYMSSTYLFEGITLCFFYTGHCMCVELRYETLLYVDFYVLTLVRFLHFIQYLAVSQSAES